MALNKLIAGAAAVAAVTMSLAAMPAAAATESSTTNIGNGTFGGPFFQITAGTPFSTSISSAFGNTISTPSTSFDDKFTFEIPFLDGVGSGSVSTSFSGASNELTISDVFINGAEYTAAQAAAGVSGIEITRGVENTIEVLGMTSAGNTGASYDGTATFTAVSPAPEPATWMLMIGGIGFIGAMLRRRRDAVRFA